MVLLDRGRQRKCLEKVQRRAVGMVSGLTSLRELGAHNARRAQAPAGHAAGPTGSCLEVTK
jgi:hypothetical protein